MFKVVKGLLLMNYVMLIANDFNKNIFSAFQNEDITRVQENFKGIFTALFIVI